LNNIEAAVRLFSVLYSLLVQVNVIRV